MRLKGITEKLLPPKYFEAEVWGSHSQSLAWTRIPCWGFEATQCVCWGGASPFSGSGRLCWSLRFCISKKLPTMLTLLS